MLNFFNYLLVFNVFAGGFVLFSVPFEFYLGYVFIILFFIMYLLCYHNISLNSTFLKILMVLTFFSLINIFFDNNTFFFMAKQVSGILITGAAYYLLVKVNAYRVEDLFKIYLRVALIVALIGLFQELSFLVKFHNGYDYSYIIPKWWLSETSFGLLRVNSIFMEPSHFAITMAPACFVAVRNLFKKNTLFFNRLSSVLIITSFILTFSAIAYIGIVIIILIIFSNVKKLRYVVVPAAIILLFVFAAYRYMPEMRMRFDHTLKVITGKRPIASANLSTYSIASNAFVAYKSFGNSPLFGSGLGSHPISYDKAIYCGSPGEVWRIDAFGLNKEEAGSLFFRLLSETGLFGLIVVFYFILKFYVRKKDDDKLKIINNAVLPLIVLQLLKQGHYFYNGLFFFIWVYYFAYKIKRKPELSY